MNWKIINVIIGREYVTRVKKKSFLLITFLGPVFFALITVLPALILNFSKEEAKKVAVVDDSGFVRPYLKDSRSVTFSDCSGRSVDSLKAALGEMEEEAVLYVSAPDSATRSVSVCSYSVKPLGMELQAEIEAMIDKSVEDYRMKSYEIRDLDKILQEVRSDVRITTYTLDDSGGESVTSSGVYMMVSMVLGMIIYLFITIFSSMVSSSVLEEKSSRVVEVLVSSVKATELMFGKIIGIAMVAVTQFLLWVVLTGVLVGIAGLFVHISDMMAAATMQTQILPGSSPLTEGMTARLPETQPADAETVAPAAAGEGVANAVSGGDGKMQPADAETVAGMTGENAAGTVAAAGAMSPEMAAMLSTLAGLNYPLLLLSFLLYFVLGYLLYASLFAAVASAMQNESDNDAAQLQIPITIPLLIGFFIALFANKSPDSALAFWGSMIPFTSPIVMLARLPFGVPAWQLVLSLGLLFLTFVALAWLSAKIYKIGILMFGKCASWKDLWRWLHQK